MCADVHAKGTAVWEALHPLVRALHQTGEAGVAGTQARLDL